MERALGVRIAGMVAALVLGMGLVAVGVFLVRQGLDRSAQWASVFGVFLNLVGVLTALFSAWMIWRGRGVATGIGSARPDTTQRYPRVVNQSVHCGSDAYVAGRDQTIVRHTWR
ncbi:MAG TPA: hypothetical protein VGX25_04880 [Actinophytocola sp.]|uniref:hypothetical protein n=1 Tax=Actinophytocola sp. TaxID=1872138 RepID=UPI002DDD10C0|nr:hypothetical protein [Actinophytocola sp.]HEV2778716.1 hypothetical protein [Actinophytocola sp.]